jgi:poly-gamma-glutamate synthesis protein (capsule biosynthesis protein)
MRDQETLRESMAKKLGCPRVAAALLVLAVVCAGLPSGCSGGRSVDKEVRKPVGLALPFGELAEKSKALVTIAGAGDVNFGDGVTPYISSGGVDYPWESASAVFKNSDLGFVNLECCISSGGSPAPGKAFTFRGPADSATGLSSAGVRVVSLANNHSKDFGTGALLETLAHLKENDVAFCGAGNNSDEAYSPAVLTAHGRKVAFLAFTAVVPDGWAATESNPGCAVTFDHDRVASAIRDAKAKSDYVVASFHWGMELATSPDADQRGLAHLAVDSGADLVLGHHPHVVQGLELYRNRLIAYSLGNFIFSPPREISSKTFAVMAVLGPEGLVQAKIVPMFISACRPVIVSGGAATSWLGTVAGYCRELGTGMTIRGERGFIGGSPAQSGGPPR